MKKILLPLVLLFISSCASSNKEQKVTQQPEATQERNVASYNAECKIIKHPSKDLYNLSMYGHSYNNYWYDELEMELLYQRFVSQGRCD